MLRRKVGCEFLHPFLDAGICHFCKQFYRNGSPETWHEEDGTACHWNQREFATWLVTSPIAEFGHALTALANSGVAPEVFLSILPSRMPSPSEGGSFVTAAASVKWAPKIHEVEAFERAVENDPQNRILRALLVSHYRSLRRERSDAEMKLLLSHIVCLA